MEKTVTQLTFDTIFSQMDAANAAICRFQYSQFGVEHLVIFVKGRGKVMDVQEKLDDCEEAWEDGYAS